MHYIQKRVLGEDEKIVALARIHWFHGVKGLMWFLGPVFVWLIIDTLMQIYSGYISITVFRPLETFFLYLLLALSAMGGFIFLIYLIKLLDTELALTSQRVIYKTGLIFVDVKEIDLEEIKAADVDHGMFGRFLGYGYIFLDSRFVENLNVPMIARPYEFVKKLNAVREAIKQDSMHLVLEDRWDDSQNEIVEEVRERLGGKGTPPRKQKMKRLHDKIMNSFAKITYRRDYEN